MAAQQQQNKRLKRLPRPCQDVNQPLSGAFAYVLDLQKNYDMSLDEIEQFLRRQKSCIYLFGEDPKKSRYFIKGYVILHFKTKAHVPFMLKISIRNTQEEALLDTEDGCHDIDTNLERLKQTGMMMSPDGVDSENKSSDDDKAFAEGEVDRLCAADQFPGVYHSYIEPYYSEIMAVLKANPLKMALLIAKGCYINRAT